MKHNTNLLSDNLTVIPIPVEDEVASWINTIPYSNHTKHLERPLCAASSDLPLFLLLNWASSDLH